MERYSFSFWCPLVPKTDRAKYIETRTRTPRTRRNTSQDMTKASMHGAVLAKPKMGDPRAAAAEFPGEAVTALFVVEPEPGSEPLPAVPSAVVFCRVRYPWTGAEAAGALTVKMTFMSAR